MKKCLLFFVLFSLNAYAQNLISKVIELRYITASRVMTLVEPLLQPGEQISGSGQTLVVKLKPKTLTQLRDLLHKIDTAPATFEITIFQGNPEDMRPKGSLTRVYRTPSRINKQRSQSVKVMNGESAFVSTNEEVPIVTSVGVGLWTGVNYEQRLIKNGLLVEPLLQGHQVKLSIKRIREANNQIIGQRFDNQETVTTIMVPLDQWVALSSAEGATAPGQSTDQMVRTYSAGNTFSQQSTLYIKVHLIPN